MVKKGRVKKDESVIKTKRDNRRATKEGDDVYLTDEDTDVQKQSIENNRFITTLAQTQYLRTKARTALKRDEEVVFPFLRLPAEIRNMVYRHIVLSRSPSPIRLDRITQFVPYVQILY